MSGASKLRLFWGALAALALLAVPFLALLPFGFAWLWQGGWILHWSIAAGCAVAAAALVWRRWRSRAAATVAPAAIPPDAAWSARDEAAWARVKEVADGVDGAVLSDPAALAALGRRVVESVARHYHEDEPEAVWAFTLPEALLLTERVSRDMRRLVRENIPFGDRIKVGQLVRVYGWTPYFEYLRKALDTYRIVRFFANPLLSAAWEAREKLTREVMSAMTDALTARIARLFALEVGRAAIDLYGGRLRLSDDEIAAYASKAAARDAARAPPAMEPLRIVVAGQVSAGKSSLINALSAEVRAAVDVLPTTRDFTPYRIAREGVPAAILLDSPGLDGEAEGNARLIAEASESDLVLWVAAANRPARDVDRRALDAFRAHFAARPNRRRPPMVLVASHVDRLRPFGAWSPPYDLRDAGSPKAVSIREAIAAMCEDLGFEPEDAVPACLAEEVGRYNVDTVWARIARSVPDARKAQLNRILSEAGEEWDWSRLWSQAVGAGRVLARAMRS